MIKDSKGEVREEFKLLWKYLADIDSKYYKMDLENSRLVFICEDMPGHGPSDLVLHYKLTEEEIFNEI